MVRIGLATSDGDIRRCFPVMNQLRTHLIEREFVPQVRRQMGGGYQLAFVEDDGEVRCVAGFRIGENLAAGRNLYIDDLVTDAAARSKAYGQRLMGWMVERAKEERCNTLELDSGVQRFGRSQILSAQSDGDFQSSLHARPAATSGGIVGDKRERGPRLLADVWKLLCTRAHFARESSADITSLF